MKTINISVTGSFPFIIGRRGENAVTEIVFDFSAWNHEFGSGVCTLLVKRPRDGSAYPVALTYSGNTAKWLVSSTDTAQAGFGTAEYVYTVSEQIAKSVLFDIQILEDIGEPSATPPDPYETWIDTLTDLGAETLQNAQDAQAAQTAAETAQDKAENAQAAAETAQGKAEAAQGKAEDAAAAAETAQTAAETAQGKAEDAEAAAEAAQTAAETAQGKAEDAAAAAEAAQTAAETAQGKAEDAAAAAETAQDKAEDAQAAAEAALAGLTIDPELSASSTNAIQNKAVTEALLPSGFVEIPWQYNKKYYSTSGDTIDPTARISSSNFNCSVVDCGAGDVFTINGKGNSANTLPWVFIDSSNNVISKAEWINVKDEVVTAPAGASKLILNNRFTTFPDNVCYYGVSDSVKSKTDSMVHDLGLKNSAFRELWTVSPTNTTFYQGAFDDQSKRACIVEAAYVPYDMRLEVDAGYEYDVLYFASADITIAPTGSSSWRSTPLTIPAGSYICVLVRNTSGTNIDPSEFWHVHDVRFVPFTETEKLLNGFYLPVYWETYLNGKYPTLWAKDALVGAGGDSFVFVTDIHSERNNLKSPALIQNIIKNTAVKTVFCGGDIIDTEDTVSDAIALLEKWQGMMCGPRVFNIVGNHDNNNYDSSQPSAAITKGQYYGVMVKPAEQWTNTGGELYYCVDNESQKIRYICLAIEAFDSVGSSGAQRTWLQSKLTEKDSSWTVLIIQHRIWNPTLEIDTKAQAVINAVNEVWSSINADFIGILAGHAHRDYSGTETTNGYLLIACNCDTNSGTSSGYTRSAGTTTEQSLDVFYIDKTNKKLYAVRIGAGDTTVGSGTGLQEWTYGS